MSHRMLFSMLVLLVALGRPAIAQELAAEPTARDKALQILLESATGEDPAMRSNALEALHADPARVLPLTDKGLRDENPGVRFAAAVTVGMLKLKNLAPSLSPLLSDTNASVRAAALYALHVLGEEVDLTPLSEMLSSEDVSLRGNVVMLLGLMGDESAVPMLRRAADQNTVRIPGEQRVLLRIQVAEAMSRLGDHSSLDALRAGAYNPMHTARLLSITAMGAVGDRAMQPALIRLMTDPEVPAMRGANPQEAAVVKQMRAELRLACAGALARIGDFRGSGVALEYAGSDNPMVRSQAAWSMGWMKDGTTLTKLAELMDDASPQVRLSAAASVLKRSSEPPV